MLKINNPGNIRISPTIYIGEIVPSANKSFKEFQSMQFGYRQMFVCINSYITKHKIDLLEDIIYRWQPPVENDSKIYVQFVCDKSGFNRQTKFIKSDIKMIDLVYQMSWIENGVKPSMRDVELGYNIINATSIEDANKIIQDEN